jgi:Fe-S-cluster containining protein
MLENDEKAAFLDAIDRVRQRAAGHLGSNRDDAVGFVANLHRAVDKVMQQSADSGARTECRPGCACCCSVRVEATEPEIFLIAREVRQWPNAQVAALVERLRHHAADGAGRSDCAFLKDRLCSIYAVRPVVCRRAHSLAAESCKRFAPEIPQRLELLLQAGVLMQGTSEAYRQMRLRSSGHELCRTVLLALTDETAEARWLDGESVFPEDCG